MSSEPVCEVSKKLLDLEQRSVIKFLRGKRFSSDEEVKEAVTTWFEDQSKDFFFQGDKFVAKKVGEVY